MNLNWSLIFELISTWVPFSCRVINVQQAQPAAPPIKRFE